MKSLEIPNLSDEVYARIERQAHIAGRSVAEVAADLLARASDEEEKEAKLMGEIAAEREELARQGVYLTDEDIDAAIRWGRE